MSRNKKKKKRGLSNGFKWVVTFLLVIVAISMVIICVRRGVFHFEAGTVTANDDNVVTTEPPEGGEQTQESDSSSKYTVFVTAGNGGTANPAGSVSVEAWDSITVSFTPDDGYVVESVTLDGQELGAVSSYTISYIDANHTVVATFAEEPEETEEPEIEGEGGNPGDTGTAGDPSIEEMITNGITDMFEKIIGG